MASSTTSLNMASSGSPQIGKIKTVLLNETNYFQWSYSTRLFVDAKQMSNYIDGTAKEPARDSPSYRTWKANNSLVQSWLLHSMKDHVCGTVYTFSDCQGCLEQLKPYILMVIIQLAYMSYIRPHLIFDMESYH